LGVCPSRGFLPGRLFLNTCKALILCSTGTTVPGEQPEINAYAGQGRKTIPAGKIQKRKTNKKRTGTRHFAGKGHGVVSAFAENRALFSVLRSIHPIPGLGYGVPPTVSANSNIP
jgi:hypothetical protein